MITIISGTNRTDSTTLKVAKIYQAYINEMGEKAEVLSLEGINFGEPTEELNDIEQHLFIPTTKYIFVIPEYNGSFPGVVKALIDLCDIPPSFHGKKALLTGISDGRAGNLRGMEHFTGILHHMKMLVHPNRLPISSIYKMLDKEGQFTDQTTIRVVKDQIKEFIDF